MIFCNQCGSSVTEGSPLCPECGTALPFAAPPQTPLPTPHIDYQPAQAVQAAEAALPPRTSNTVLIAVGTAIVTLLLVAIGFVGGRSWRTANHAALNRDTVTSDDHQNNEVTTKTEPTSASTVHTPAPTPPGTDNLADLARGRQEVLSTLNTWVTALRARDFDKELSYYADTLDVFYSRRNVNAEFVRDLHYKLFTKYSTLDMQLTNINIQISQSGSNAVATFDKTFNFQGEKNYSGAVQSQWEWTKINGTWRITSEKDLKIYYVNKEK